MALNVRIKICGMRVAENIRAVAMLRPDYMGFIFYERSPRYVGESFKLPDDFPSAIIRVGVFVNHSLEYVLNKVLQCKLEMVQLHGDESPAFCSELKSHGVRIIKAFRVDDDFNFSLTMPYEKCVDYFLFDTKGKLYGGNATSFNWEILMGYNQRVPFFLSGGLNESNLKEIHKFTSWNLHAIDLNSGVEDAPGVKNIDKIINILNHTSV